MRSKFASAVLTLAGLFFITLYDVSFLLAQDSTGADTTARTLRPAKQDTLGLLLYLAGIAIFILAIYLVRSAVRKPAHKSASGKDRGL
jgi:hypothetical protein